MMVDTAAVLSEQSTDTTRRNPSAPLRELSSGVCEECSKKDDGELLGIAYQGCRKIGHAKNKMNVGRA